MRRLIILALVLSASSAFAADASLASPIGDVYEVEFRFRTDSLAAGVPCQLSQGVSRSERRALAADENLRAGHC